MTTTERGAGLPSWSLSPQNYSVAYGQAHPRIKSGDMSETGAPAASGWFGPLAPLAPIAPKEVAGRAFDFPSGYNIATKPRSFEPISVEDLRALAETYDLLRIVIETRKDQVERLPWSLRVKPGKQGPGAARLDELTAFFERPDREHEFSLWLRLLLEDLFVLDSPTLWRQRRRNGELYALHPLDGATIKRVIDDWGRTPQPFEQDGQLIYPAAYQQILKGYPAINYSTRDIVYAPRNLRPGRIYGLSPVEQIVMTVCTALKRQTFTLTHFTEGNIPESLIGVPESWTPDQIKNFQDYWDAYFTGDLAARRRAKFVPGGVAKTFIQTKEPELKGAFDEWLARVVCYAFSVSPQAFVSQVNRATGETQKEMAEEEGLRPILNWVKRLIDRVLVEDFNEREVEFVFGQDERIDPPTQAQMLIGYVGAGILTRNEARAKLGLAPVDDAAANELTVTTGAGGAFAGNAPAEDLVKFDPGQPRDERGRWTIAPDQITPASGKGGHRLRTLIELMEEAVRWIRSHHAEERAPHHVEERTSPLEERRPTLKEQPGGKPAEATPRVVAGALPNAEHAVIDPKKIYNYALDPDHPNGGPKARVFEAALGYNRSNGDQLITQIKEGVLQHPAEVFKVDKHGTHFRVDMPITGPNGITKTVRTGWVLDSGASTPRLATAFILER